MWSHQGNISFDFTFENSLVFRFDKQNLLSLVEEGMGRVDKQITHSGQGYTDWIFHLGIWNSIVWCKPRNPTPKSSKKRKRTDGTWKDRKENYIRESSNKLNSLFRIRNLITKPPTLPVRTEIDDAFGVNIHFFWWKNTRRSTFKTRIWKRTWREVKSSEDRVDSLLKISIESALSSDGGINSEKYLKM